MKNKKEYIEFAALTRDGKIYTGRHHGCILQKLVKDKIFTPSRPMEKEEAGFVTNNGRFVSREEAATIAFNSGQIGPGTNSLDSYQIFPEINRM